MTAVLDVVGVTKAYGDYARCCAASTSASPSTTRWR